MDDVVECRPGKVTQEHCLRVAARPEPFGGVEERVVPVAALEAVGQCRDVKQEVGLHHHQAGLHTLSLRVTVEQVQLHPLAQHLAQVLMLRIVHLDVPAVGSVGPDGLPVEAADDAAQVACIDGRQGLCADWLERQPLQQFTRNARLEHRRDKQRQRMHIVQPLLAAQHRSVVGVAPHLLHRHTLRCLHAAPLRQVVDLREQVAEARTRRLQCLSAAQHQRLVHKAVACCRRFRRRQFQASFKKFLYSHISFRAQRYEKSRTYTSVSPDKSLSPANAAR